MHHYLIRLCAFVMLSGVLLCAVVLCAGKSPLELLHGQHFDTLASRALTIQSDGRSHLNGFVLHSSFSNAKDEWLCVSIVPRLLWETGDHADALRRTLIRNLKITINRKPVPRGFIDLSWPLTADFAMTTNGNGIGSYGAPINACFTTRFLPTACYTVAVHEARVSGKAEDYGFQLCVGQPQYPYAFLDKGIIRVCRSNGWF